MQIRGYSRALPFHRGCQILISWPCHRDSYLHWSHPDQTSPVQFSLIGLINNKFKHKCCTCTQNFASCHCCDWWMEFACNLFCSYLQAIREWRLQNKLRIEWNIPVERGFSILRLSVLHTCILIRYLVWFFHGRGFGQTITGCIPWV